MKLISYLPFPVPKVFGLVVGCARRVRFYSEEECSGCAYGILLLHTRARIGVGRGCYGSRERLVPIILVPIGNYIRGH